ncbi:MAG TPA: DUF3277 family protein [Candidatus Aphodomonas merdavium]|nr:DUF3277 family protein [Candidatus Aphodomonas merdavium]
MNYSTYSFSDHVLVLNHPSLGQLTLTGEGCSNIKVGRSVVASQNDLAHDGSVMTSKIMATNGLLSFSVLQTSSACISLRKWYTYLEKAPSSEWAQITARLENTVNGDVSNMSGGSFEKLPDKTVMDKGQSWIWNFLFQKVDY